MENHRRWRTTGLGLTCMYHSTFLKGSLDQVPYWCWHSLIYLEFNLKNIFALNDVHFSLLQSFEGCLWDCGEGLDRGEGPTCCSAERIGGQVESALGRDAFPQAKVSFMKNVKFFYDSTKCILSFIFGQILFLFAKLKFSLTSYLYENDYFLRIDQERQEAEDWKKFVDAKVREVKERHALDWHHFMTAGTPEEVEESSDDEFEWVFMDASGRAI